MNSFQLQTVKSIVPKNALVPSAILLQFLEGKKNPITLANDPEAKGYSEQDIDVVLKEARHNIGYIKALPSFSQTQPLWISSAGGPAAGKTTALLKFVIDTCYLSQIAQDFSDLYYPVRQRAPFAFVSADRQSLYGLSQRLIQKATESFYTYWRSATNGLSNLDLSVAYDRKVNVLHDTTLAGFSNLPKAVEAGYYPVVIAVASPFETRKEAADRRNKNYFQSFPFNVEDQDKKFGDNLPKIIGDAREVHFMWRDTSIEATRPVALVVDGKIKVLEQGGFDKFCDLYPKMRGEILPALIADDSLVSAVPRILSEQKLEVGAKYPHLCFS